MLLPAVLDKALAVADDDDDGSDGLGGALPFLLLSTASAAVLALTGGDG